MARTQNKKFGPFTVIFNIMENGTKSSDDSTCVVNVRKLYKSDFSISLKKEQDFIGWMNPPPSQEMKKWVQCSRRHNPMIESYDDNKDGIFRVYNLLFRL